eukprot:5656918-Pleurochrysis_carterae.AAC.1
MRLAGCSSDQTFTEMTNPKHCRPRRLPRNLLTWRAVPPSGRGAHSALAERHDATTQYASL